jgi:hypothetical protein
VIKMHYSQWIILIEAHIWDNFLAICWHKNNFHYSTMPKSQLMTVE